MNNKAALQSAIIEATIRQVWINQLKRNPFAHVSAKTIGAELPNYIPRSTISWHMDNLRRRGLDTSPIFVPPRE